MNILVTVDKFGDEARDLLESFCLGKHTVTYNNTRKKLTQKELLDLIEKTSPDIIVAGTEKYSKETLSLCKNLKVLSRVGIGLDSVDLEVCEIKNISVKNTPDAPTSAVAELTVGQIFNTLRRIQEVDHSIREKKWLRYNGKDLQDCTVGVVGYGRIGSRVSKMISTLCKEIFVCEIDDKVEVSLPAKKVSFNEVLTSCDIITLHVPLTKLTKNLLASKELELLKKDSILINTSRGGIINEEDLYGWLLKNKKALAAIDVFEQEPYTGKLAELPNCYLTAHLGSCTVKARHDMEVGAVKNILNYL